LKDQAVGNFLIGMLCKGEEDPAIVDVAMRDRIWFIKARHHHCLPRRPATAMAVSAPGPVTCDS
jgi:hypothetical protein